MKKNKLDEVPVVWICEFCHTEMTGGYQHIKTKRGSDLYICDKCLKGQLAKNKAV